MEKSKYLIACLYSASFLLTKCMTWKSEQLSLEVKDLTDQLGEVTLWSTIEIVPP